MKAWSKEKELDGLSDAQLVQCFAEGNNVCFTKIVERHHTHVHELLHYILHNATLEKDAEQDTFFAVGSDIRSGRYHNTEHLDKYLNTVAYHVALHLLREERHYVHGEAALSNDEQTEETAEEIFPERERNTALVRLGMKKLSPHYMQALQFRDVDEMSFREIGLQMGISETGARTLYFKAKRRLKIALEKLISERRSARNKDRR